MSRVFEHPARIYRLTLPEGWRVGIDPADGQVTLTRHPAHSLDLLLVDGESAAGGLEVALGEMCQSIDRLRGVGPIETADRPGLSAVSCETIYTSDQGPLETGRAQLALRGQAGVFAHYGGPPDAVFAEGVAILGSLELLVDRWPATDPLAFARLVATLLREDHPGARVEVVGPDALSIDGEPRLGLSNLARWCATDPENARSIVAAWIAKSMEVAAGGLDAAAPDLAKVRASIRPQLKTRALLGEVPLAAHQDLGVADLLVTWVVDAEHTMTYVLGSWLAAWHIDQAELHRLALANLDAASQRIQFQVAGPSEEDIAMVIVATGDGYDAVRVLLPGVAAQIAELLRRRSFLVGLPTRDHLVAFRDDIPIVGALREQVAAQHASEPWPLTPLVLGCAPDADGQPRLELRS